jgi:hypothetical protein
MTDYAQLHTVPGDYQIVIEELSPVWPEPKPEADGW